MPGMPLMDCRTGLLVVSQTISIFLMVTSDPEVFSIVADTTGPIGLVTVILYGVTSSYPLQGSPVVGWQQHSTLDKIVCAL